eukprot:19182-Heterococcus_DN1.PRE.6
MQHGSGTAADAMHAHSSIKSIATAAAAAAVRTTVNASATDQITHVTALQCCEGTHQLERDDTSEQYSVMHSKRMYVCTIAVCLPERCFLLLAISTASSAASTA